MGAYTWIAIGKDRFRVILVFLALHAVSKIDAIVKSIRVCDRDQELVLQRVIHRRPHFVPTASLLLDSTSSDIRTALDDIIATNGIFKFGQFLQGENNPGQIFALQCFLKTADSSDLLNCCLVGSFGIMSAYAATTPHSTSMDTHFGALVILGLRCLQNVEHGQPQRLYWSFIQSRARILGLPVSTLEDYVLARLACLIRATSEDCSTLRMAWNALSRGDKEQLTEHFVADGIGENSYLMSFLPDYLLNARTNAFVGLM